MQKEPDGHLYSGTSVDKLVPNIPPDREAAVAFSSSLVPRHRSFLHLTGKEIKVLEEKEKKLTQLFLRKWSLSMRAVLLLCWEFIVFCSHLARIVEDMKG